jgi:para-nitrobenzyl esterase
MAGEGSAMTRIAPGMAIRDGVFRRTLLRASALAAAAASTVDGVSGETASKAERQAAVSTPTSAVVETVSGKVRGFLDRGIYTYKGIPYAASTEGKNRWLAPQKPTSWPGVREAMVYGPVCPSYYQGGGVFPFHMEPMFAQESEDCLRVNVWTPGINDNRKRPVLVWLHSMGFHSGSGHQFRVYDGANLARRGDAVVVTLNHRINIFGFCNLKEYDDRLSQSANVGMLDIVAALQWVRDNIARFGGNPENVTVFGQSGGGMKICTLFAMPQAQGLFHKAIVQSGPRLRSGTLEGSARLSAGVVRELGISGDIVQQLQEVDFRKLRSAAMSAARTADAPQPIVDGLTVVSHPLDEEALEMSSQIPLLIGTTLHEGNRSDKLLSESDLDEIVRKRFPGKFREVTETLKRTYPSSSANERLAIVTSYYRRDSIQIAARKAALNAAPVFVYQFAWETPIFAERPARAIHFSDLPFTFDNTDLCPHATGGTKEARKLAARISEAWVRFARTGNPNHPGLPQWPRFSAERDSTMFFNDRCEVKFDHDRELLRTMQG